LAVQRGQTVFAKRKLLKYMVKTKVKNKAKKIRKTKEVARRKSRKIKAARRTSKGTSITSSSVNEKKTIQSEDPIIMQSPRGMHDILPGEQPYWNQIRKSLNHAFLEYGFQRIDTPILEHSNLFVRSIGKGTDIIDKEMYTFITKGRDRVALRPEFTASIARAYIQHGMNVLPKPIKLFSTGTVYRYDRPQEGRYREHRQANFDILGEQDPILDAQLIQLADRVLNGLGIKNVQFQINSIGCPKCREEYLELLESYFESKRSKLCHDCKKRLENNPLRILDCKEDKCAQVSAGAPQSIDHLCEECRTHFKHLLEYLDELEVSYVINPRLVRGLNYYTKTVFEIWSSEEGKKYSLGGGGRYDKLIETLGGESTPAIGFALGLDRLAMEMKRTKVKLYKEPKPRVFLAQLGDLAKKKSLKLFSDLERGGILTAESFGRGSLRSQLRTANRLGVEIALIIGQKEALDGTAIVKNMSSGVQETAPREKLTALIKKILKNNNVTSVRSRKA